ncbi:hypothetical protein F2P56_011279 [Juglans regia]|uniref:RNase H type-1 domain-containing protein n=1 Tax=Juglans regia TaxID=51240 RepID=A0A833XUS0_JUGRE|nr:hypothetical protein F2P56_011279 [Juglans regia]
MKGLWSRRNNTYHGKEFQHPTALHQQAKTDLAVYQEAITEDRAVKFNARAGVPKWKKPEVGSLKVNWDAAVNLEEGRIGIGVLIRDHDGLVMGSLRASRNLKGTPFFAEAYDLLLAAVFCKEIGLTHVCLEGDSKQVVDLLQNCARNWSLGGCLVEDAREILNSYAAWSVTHVYREANMASHLLANNALEATEDTYDLETCPSCIFPIVSKEML